MRVLIVTQVFPPETHPTAVMFAELASHLTRAGHAVTVAAGYPHHPHGRLVAGYVKRPLAREFLDGVTVLRGWHWISEDTRVPMRAAVMASQAIGTAMAALAADKPDVVLTVGLPVIGPLLSAVLARRFGAKFVSVVYDIYPDVAVETGKLRNEALIGIAHALERVSYRASDSIVVLSNGFKRSLMAKGVEPSKIEVVPVWLDPDEIRPLPRDNAWRREQKISPETKVVLYAGTIGLVSGAHVVLDAAQSLRDRGDILFLFVGEGRLKDELEVRARSMSLTNVRFMPFQPRDRLPEVQSTADLSLVTLAPGRGRTSVPSKVAGYMAAGRPVIASVDISSDTADAVRASRGGVIVEPGDASALAKAVRNLVDSADLRAMGRASRSYFEEQYARPSVLSHFETVLKRAAGASMRRNGSRQAVVRPMAVADVRSVVEVHLRAFPGFFLTFLGPSFLRLFYGEAIRFGEPAFVAEVDGQVVGFVMGSGRPGAFYAKLLRHRLFSFALAAVPAVLRRPSTAMRVARALVKPKEAAKASGVATLMSLGVEPSVQGLGAGKKLVDAFLAEAARRGATRVDLTTDKYGNERTNAFYARLGFRVSREIVTPEKRTLYEYEIVVPRNQASA